MLLHNNFILQFETSAVGPTAAFVVLWPAIYIYRLFNERPGRGSFVSSHFVWVFLSPEGISSIRGVDSSPTGQARNAKVGVRMVADDNEKTPHPHPHPHPPQLAYKRLTERHL